MVDTWRLQPLRRIATLQRGFDLPHRNRKPGGVPIVTSSGIADTHCESKVAGPGVVTGRYGTIGEVFYVQTDFWPLNTTLYVKDFHGNHPLFVSYLLRTIDFHSHSGKSGVPGVNRNDLHEISVCIPPTQAEQTAIANVLSDADSLIESLEQLIVKKRHLKQGAMQELLRPKVGWFATNLGSLGVFLKGSGVRKDESMTGDLPCVRYGEIYTRHNDYIKAFHSRISSEVAVAARRLRTGDLLFAGSGETKEEIGKCVAFVDNIEAYAGGDIVILRPEDSDSTFLGYYLNTVSINRQKASRGQGDAVVHIGSAALSSIDLIIPPIDEQTAIAAVLSDMDAEIAALEAKLAKARRIKQGMMHNLLTGRIRLV
ncbi:MAG: restriction endonuclease subunit S [Bryobacteraceae bacterium]